MRIAKDFLEKYQFPKVRQPGIVVADVENAAAELENKGIGPFFTLPRAILHSFGRLQKMIGARCFSF